MPNVKEHKVIGEAQRAAVREWTKKQVERGEALRSKTTELALAKLRRANLQVNGPQLMAAAVPAFIAAGFGAWLQSKVVGWTAGMVEGTAAADQVTIEWSNRWYRSLLTWAGVPAFGALISWQSLRWGSKGTNRGGTAAAGFGLGLGLAIGSFVSSLTRPVIPAPPPVTEAMA